MACILLVLISLFCLSNGQLAPNLQFFGINLLSTPEQLAMIFNISVDPTTCDVTAITLHSSSNLNNGSSYSPTSGSCMEHQGQLSIILSSSDWQVINNDPVLASSQDTTYLTLGEFISSAEGVANTPITMPVQASFFLGAPSALTVDSSLLDLNNGILSLQFSTDVSNLDISRVSLVNTLDNNTLQLSGSNGNPVPSPASNVNISLLEGDWITLKLQFGSSVNFTVWNVILQDNAASTNNGLSNTFTVLTLGGLIPDSTPPLVTSISIDMDAGQIMITFNEPIDSLTYNLHSVFLVNTSSQPFPTNYSLSNLVASQSPNFLSFTISMSSNLLLELKADDTILTSVDTSFVYFQPDSFSDYSNNLIAATTMANASSVFTPDVTKPVLNSFEVLLDFGTMDMTFDEPISRSSFNASYITLLTTQTNTLTLDEEVMITFTVFQTIVRLTFSAQQVNDVKLLLFNADSNATLKLAMEEMVCSDTSNNLVIAIEASNSLQAMSVSLDVRHPSLVSLSPDRRPPQSYALSFTFSEYINPSSFNPTSLVLTLTNSVAGMVTYNMFEGGVVTNVNYLTLMYHFNISSLSEEFPLLYQIAYYSGNMTVTFGSELVTDLAGNIIMTPFTPILISSNESDPILPALQSFSIDLTQSILLLTFTEPVILVAPNNSLVIQDDISGSNTHTFSSSIYSGLQGRNGISFQINLSPNDVQILLANNRIATGTDNTFLQITQNFAVDYSGNSLNNTTPVQAMNVIVPLATSTTLVSSLSITPSPSSSSELLSSITTQVSSSEVVVSSTPQVQTTSTLQLSSTAIEPSTVVVSSTQVMTSSVVSTTIAVASSIESTSIVSTVSSTPQPSVAPIPITEVSLDMNSGILNVSLSMAIQLSGFIVSGNIMLSNGTQSVTLTGHNGVDFSDPESADQFTINLNTPDLNLLKSFRISVSWSATVQPNTFVDGNGGANTLQTLPFNTFIADTTPPALTVFDLDMNLGTITLNFTESVVTSSLNITSIFITHSLANFPPNQYAITGGIVLPSALDSVTIVLNLETLNSIKCDSSVATGFHDSFVFISHGSIEDYNSNLIQPIGAQASIYIADTTSPNITSFQLDLNTGTMMLTFTEPVITDSLDTTGSTIAGTVAATISADIIGTFIGASNCNTFISLSIQSNLNEIKLVLYSSSSAFIAVPPSFVSDMAGNVLTSIPESSRLSASNIIPDTVQPSVTGFIPNALSPDNSSISFTFNEYVALPSLSESSMVITLTNSSQTYQDFSSGLWTTAIDNATVTYYFSQSDKEQFTFGLVYLLSINTGQVTVLFSSSLAQDLANNNVTVPASPLIYTANQQDNTSPRLQSFEIDLDTGSLTLSFTEEVILQIIAGNIQFQNAVSNPIATYTLSSNSYNSQTGSFGSSINIALNSLDTSTLINNTNLTNSIADTFILLTDQLVIDYSGNSLNVTSPIQASNVITPLTPDNPPIIETATIDLNEGSLLLTFNTALNTLLTVSSSISIINGLLTYHLDSNANVDLLNNNETILHILFSQSDSISIKFLFNNTFDIISIDSNTIFSTDGEGNQPQTIQIATVIPDTIGPLVIFYSFDMNFGLMVITFNEPISNTTYNDTGIWLTNTTDTQPTGLPLTDSNIITSANSNTVLTMMLSVSILNTIKSDPSLAVTISTTFLYFSAGSFQDISSNGLQSSIQSSWTSLYIEDSTPPQLVSFTLDLDSGVLSMSFSETVGTATFDVSQLTLYSSNLSNSVTVNNYTHLTMEFGSTFIDTQVQSTSLNSLKVILNGGFVVRLSMTSNTVEDTSSNPVIAISSTNPLTSTSVVPDTTAPSLISLRVGDQTQRTLEMMFSEYVQPSSWNGAGLTLYLNTSIGLFTYTGFTDGTVSSDISFNITYTISTAKFQGLLSIRYQQAYYSGSIGVSLSSTVLTDFSSNAIVATATPVYYFSMMTDSILPQLTSFELNLDTAMLVMVFSEPVLINQIPNNVRIQNSASSPTQSLTLTSSTYSTQEGTNGTSITLVLLLQDVISIAVNDNLGSIISNTYLHLEANMAVDYSGNFLQVPSNALQASSVTGYSGQLNPQVTSFDLDLDSDQMTLHFSSPVNVSTLVASKITLLNTTGVPLSSVSLSNVTLIAQGEQSDFRFLLNIQDIISIKRHPLCYTTANCYASFSHGLAFNNIQLPSLSTSPIQVASLVQDVTPPRFLSFPIFDLNSGIFTIVFSEPINGSSTNFTVVTFSNMLTNPTQSVILTEGFTSPDSVEIDFILHRNDLNALKYRLNLCTSRENCWVKLPSFFVSDIGSNPFLHTNNQVGATASYHQPTVFIPDTTPPILESFDIDMNIGQLVLSFNEVINDTLFISSDVTLLSSQSDGLSLTLSNLTDYVQTNEGTAVLLTLTIDNLNWIKARDLYSSVADSYLSLISDMPDVSGNVIVDITPSSAKQVLNYTRDTTQVQLSVFNSFNLDNGSFFITFNEPLQVSSINFTGIIFASGTTGSSITYTLTGGNATAFNDNKLSIMIDLARNDRVAIKLLTGLATSESNTYIYLGHSVVVDAAGNYNVPMSVSSAFQLQSGGFTIDTSLAELASSELDMNQGLLTLLFSDVVRADTVMPFLLSIQNKSSGNDRSTYTLSISSTASSENSDVIYIYLHQSDLNNVKANLYLATSGSNSYVVFPTTMAQDIEGRNVLGVPESAGHQVSIYIADTTSPILSSYSIDLDAGNLILTMSEPVLLQSFTPTELTIQNSINTPSSSYMLASGTVSPQTTGVIADTIITLNFDYNDLNQIKSKPALATSSTDTFLKVGSSLFTDTNSNTIVSVPAMTPSMYSGDVTLPVLRAFSLDLRTDAKVILMFSEAVYYTSSIQSTVTLQNRETNPSVILELTSTEPATQTALDEVSIALSSSHSNQLLSDSDIAETSSALYISMTAGGIYDYSAGQGQSIASVTQKVTSLYRTCFDANTYNNASLGTCELCASSCVGGCTGSKSIAGSGGCSQCDVIMLDANGNQVNCLPSGSLCPIKYYSDTGTNFAGLSSNGRLCRPCHETCATCNNGGDNSCTSCQLAFIVNSFGSLSQCTTGCGTNSSNCHYCHTQCNGCTGPSNADCVSCKGTSRINSQGQSVCSPVCGSDQYQSERNGDFICFPCHTQCIGCIGPTNTQCTRCKNANNTYTSSNECTATCPFGSYADEHSKCRACDAQCNGCTGPSSSNCTICTEDSILQTTGELVCVSYCPMWQVYDLSSTSCELTTGAQMAVIVISSATGGVLLVLAVLIACCCVFCCRRKYKVPEDMNMNEMGGGATFIRGSYLSSKTTTI